MDGEAAVIENTDTEDMHSFVVPYTSTLKTPTDANVPMTAKSRYERNEETVQQADAVTRIVPTPYRFNVNSNARTFEFDGVVVKGLALLGDLEEGALDLLDKLGLADSGRRPTTVTLALDNLPDDIKGPESYAMTVAAGGADIGASDPAGLFHGLMSFIGLLNVEESVHELQELRIRDKPRFAYRGHQVDAARNFRSTEAIRKTIDAMALYKLNVLHLAMTNDEGWRLQIPGLSELTSVGSRRCFGACVFPRLRRQATLVYVRITVLTDASCLADCQTPARKPACCRRCVHFRVPQMLPMAPSNALPLSSHVQP